MSKRYSWKLKMPKGSCAKDSMRTLKRGGNAVRVCCPKGPGHYDARTHTCRVGMRAYEVGTPRRLSGWNDDAKKAIRENPNYFVWWYTVKSVGLGVVAAVAAYYIGKDRTRTQGAT